MWLRLRRLWGQCCIEVAIECSTKFSIECSIERSVECSIECSIERSVECSIECSIERSIECSIECSVECSLAGSAERSIERSIECSIECSIEFSIECSVGSAGDGEPDPQLGAALRRSRRQGHLPGRQSAATLSTQTQTPRTDARTDTCRPCVGTCV